MSWILDNETGGRIEDRDQQALALVRYALTTYKGDTVGAPDYGSRLIDEIFERLNDGTASRLVQIVRDALTGVVSVSSLQVRTSVESATITVNGTYTVKL